MFLCRRRSRVSLASGQDHAFSGVGRRPEDGPGERLAWLCAGWWGIAYRLRRPLAGWVGDLRDAGDLRWGPSRHLAPLKPRSPQEVSVSVRIRGDAGWES